MKKVIPSAGRTVRTRRVSRRFVLATSLSFAGLSLLPKGFKGEPYRSTDGTIFACAEGTGTTIVDGKPIEWGVNDVFVIPPWNRYTHQTSSEAVLFSISDRPAQESLGMWREGN